MSALALVGGDVPRLSSQSILPVRPTDVFLVAHQDDWQLFMGDIAFRAIRRGNHAIFVYLTAGDENREADYWRTRERAALESTRLAAAVADSSRADCATVVVLHHAIRRCTIANTVSFFMRLPDGRRNGSGFERNAYQSLRKLRARTISTISAVDTSATYGSWADVSSTVAQLVQREKTTRSRVTIHANDPNPGINPRDHSDHRESGLIGASVRKNRGWTSVFYVGYALAARPDNRSREQAGQKTALFLVYDRELLLADRTWSTYAERPRFYSMCMLRTYSRKIPRR